jgi:superfamily II DNA or RNA helicase
MKKGLYEQVLNEEIEQELLESEKEYTYFKGGIDEAEAPEILSQYMSSLIAKKLQQRKDKGKSLEEQVVWLNEVIALIDDQDGTQKISEEASQLMAVFEKKDPRLLHIKKNKDIERPETSLSQSSLFTGSKNEPAMFSELKKEILSCNRIDMLVSFIKWSGLRMIYDELKTFCQNGGKLRIITTSYMGATDVKAIEKLSALPNTSIQISYDTKRTRLHAKTYVFYRDTGFSDAYIGSSNLSNAAISSGLEWNLKITMQDQPATMQKIAATFESYWYSDEFERYTPDQKDKLIQALKKETEYTPNLSLNYALKASPYPYQEEILNKLQAERELRGYWRNLVVAATGTGKTVISAFDYSRYLQKYPQQPGRLLFIAHREEILRQSLQTFRSVLNNANFGDLWVGNARPRSFDHLFMSIQTFNSQDFSEKTKPDFYDFIIVDEFHHAAAPTYQKLLSYYEPKILLGLTATPERMDGKDIFAYFNNRIAASIRLPQAINQKLLCPFQYFGISDDVDLSKVKWSRGGYDVSDLNHLYTQTTVAKKRADYIVHSMEEYVTSMEDVKGLGFCVSVAHAIFMADVFNQYGMKSMALSAKSSDEERKNAKDLLVSGQIKFIFVVDLYNEGVDIPQINTILFLRPTDSLTVFLQQLGRGLRLSEGKECLTVLDFIGQAHKKYNFAEKFNALRSNTDRSLMYEIEQDAFSAPTGCYMHLERIASKYVLDNIKASFRSVRSFVSLIESFEADTGKQPTLANFLNHYHLDPKSIYKYKETTFSSLCVQAGLRKEFDEPMKSKMSSVLAKFSSIDSRRWIDFLLKLIDSFAILDPDSFSEMERKMFYMFCFTIWPDFLADLHSEQAKERITLLKNSPISMAELKELLLYQKEKIDLVDQPVHLGYACPLDVYCTYSRDQILAALDFYKPSTVREGVKWLANKQTDVFFVTLNKSDKQYSPTTLYDDYSINEHLFHWQSQSTTSAASVTGQRYIHHQENGSHVLLFVREYKNDPQLPSAAAFYTFLGPVSYVSHEGSSPMSITWKLEHPIPAKFIQKTNKLLLS